MVFLGKALLFWFIFLLEAITPSRETRRKLYYWWNLDYGKKYMQGDWILGWCIDTWSEEEWEKGKIKVHRIFWRTCNSPASPPSYCSTISPIIITTLSSQNKVFPVSFIPYIFCGWNYRSGGGRRGPVAF